MLRQEQDLPGLMCIEHHQGPLGSMAEQDGRDLAYDTSLLYCSWLLDAPRHALMPFGICNSQEERSIPA